MTIKGPTGDFSFSFLNFFFSILFSIISHKKKEEKKRKKRENAAARLVTFFELFCIAIYWEGAWSNFRVLNFRGSAPC